MIHGAARDPQLVGQGLLRSPQQSHHVVPRNPLASNNHLGVFFTGHHGEQYSFKEKPLSREKFSKKTTLADRLLAARTRSGLSHDRIGEIVGCSGPHLANIESGVAKHPRRPLRESIERWINTIIPGISPDRSFRTYGGVSAPHVESGQSHSVLLPPDLAGDHRLTWAINQIVDILRGAESEDVEAILGNLRVFGRDARRRMANSQGEQIEEARGSPGQEDHLKKKTSAIS